MFKGQQCKKNSFFDCLTFGTNHQLSPHNIAEERRTQLLRGGSLILAYYKRFYKNRGLWITYTGLVIVSRPDKHSYLHGSFVNAVGIGDYIASHAKTVNMNWKGYWKKWSWPSWWCYQEISTERLRKTKIIKGLFQPTFEEGTSRIQLWKFTFRITILGKWPTWGTVLFYVFIFISNSLHVSSTSCSSSGETNCVNTISDCCHSVLEAVSCAGRKFSVKNFTSDLHTTRPPTESDSYQRLYWHNLSVLMMSTMCSKHIES
jgi:hypothetical protein